MSLQEPPTRLHAPRPRRPRRVPTSIVCRACARELSEHEARLEAWERSRDGRQVHCRACADGLAIALDDVVLYWPACGHPGEADAVLYDRAVCVACEDDESG